LGEIRFVWRLYINNCDFLRQYLRPGLGVCAVTRNHSAISGAGHCAHNVHLLAYTRQLRAGLYLQLHYPLLFA
jgi:hypothetical protein